MTPLAPDPADKAGADQFQPPPTSRRAGNWTLEQWLAWFTKHPSATAESGVGGLLTAEVHRLRQALDLGRMP